MGQEKDVLIIKSDKKWKDFFIDRICGFSIWLIGFDAILIYWIVTSGPIKGIDIAMSIMTVSPHSIVTILRIYLLCRNIDRELILDKMGFWLKHGFIKESIHGMNFKLSN